VTEFDLFNYKHMDTISNIHAFDLHVICTLVISSPKIKITNNNNWPVVGI
jgi:hypothetical protein